MPCHNEVLDVRSLVARIDRHYGPYVKDFVVVDDNSRDGTADVIRDLAARDRRVRPVFRTPPNGVGRALRDGLEASTGKWVLLSDRDFS
ncbi:MAG: glycosyltransferase [Acidobacteria bacterium]|nr:MAG: glycosyltransferase [Acidobacteriota bacterium]MCE7956338.1 glycosyltransferase [Acidobacteria bacterium ACB2]